ncbi:hypothetical protein [Saccharopolyspora gloriosae]|uniref:hypothetical protein n=1 Tax=Saccharopolyspora gloriosae TaxID=455344 RepID=UPI0037CBEF68
MIEELNEIAGVSDVALDLGTAAVTVTSAEPASDTNGRTAIEEAGYQLAAQ